MARILCIDDESEFLELLTEVLVEEGHQVITAPDGPSGLAAILGQEPELVLCDVNMPGMGGFELLDRLTATAPPFAHVPFVFLTALADRDHVLQGRRLGADDYVTKPVDFAILCEIVRARLARAGPRPQPAEDRPRLSGREIEALTWSARGKTSAEIATILGVSERTVNFHMDNAMRKLASVTRTQAAVKAAREGLIEP